MNQTEEEILKSNLKFKSCSSLAELSTQLGKSEKLGLSGRPKKRVGILSTSKVYEVNNEIVIFYPEFSSVENFWIVSDPQMLTDRIKLELYYL